MALRKILIILGLFLLATPSLADEIIIIQSGAWSCSYSFCEGFEGAESGTNCTGTFDNTGWTCVTGGSSSATADDTDPYQTCGWTSDSESYGITNADGDITTFYRTIPADGTYGISMEFQVVTIPDASGEKLGLWDIQGDSAIYCYTENDATPDKFGVQCRFYEGSGWSSAVIIQDKTLSAGSWYKFDCRWSDGVNADCRIDEGTAAGSASADNAAGTSTWNIGPTTDTVAGDDGVINFDCIQYSSDYEYPDGT